MQIPKVTSQMKNVILKLNLTLCMYLTQEMYVILLLMQMVLLF